MKELSEIIRNIDVNIGPNNKAMVTLYNYFVQKSEERGKTTWGKYSLKKGQGTKLNNMSSTYIFLHLNELVELLFIVIPKSCHYHVIRHLTYLLSLNPNFWSGN